MGSLSVFVEVRFWLLVFSVVLPAALYAGLRASRAISRAAMAVLGLVLVLVAEMDVYLLQSLAMLARATLSVVDDAVFLRELSIAVCVLPLMLGGIGAKRISHVLLRHPEAAENRFERRHPHD